MKKIAYIGHSFHKKTLSTKFLIDLLLTKYEIDYYWTLPSTYKTDWGKFSLTNKKYDTLIFFQIIPTLDYLEELNSPNIVLIPMYDNDLTLNNYEWSVYYKYKFINFSSTLHNKLNKLNFKNTLYLQYAPQPIEYKNSNNKKPKIFFWQRSNEINWNLIKKIIDFSNVDSIHLHRIEDSAEKDSWFNMPSEYDQKKYNMTLSSWFETKEDFLRTLNDCDIFITPRLFEGIGQTFLEAMALGKCIISPNLPTMNEYIENGKNGILFDYLDPKPIDISEWKSIGKEAYSTIQSIRDTWNNSYDEIIEFIEKPNLIASTYNEYINELETNFKSTEDNFFIEDIKNSILSEDKKAFNFSKYLNLIHAFVNDIKDSNEKFILYGAGTGCKLLISLIPNSIECIIDKSPKLINTTIENIPIYPIEELEKLDKYPIIITVFGRSKEIEGKLNIKYSNKIISLDF